MATLSKPLSGFTALLARLTRRGDGVRVFKSQQDAFSFVRQAYAERGVTPELRAVHAEFMKFKHAREDQSGRSGDSASH